MEMDTTAVAASASTVIACSAIDQVAQPSVQSMATAPMVLPRGKKEMTVEARAEESKKRAARRVVAKQKEKDKKATEEKVTRLKSCRLFTQELPPRLWTSRPSSTPSPCSSARWSPSSPLTNLDP
jgi:hypothetical protein